MVATFKIAWFNSLILKFLLQGFTLYKAQVYQKRKSRGMKKSGGSLFRNMAILVAGAGSAKLIGLAAMPILTRIYSPVDFGALSIFVSLVGFIAPIVTFRYVMALPLPKTDDMAVGIFVICIAMIVFFCSILSVVLFFWGGHVYSLFSLEGFDSYWWLISLGVLGTSMYETFSMLATRKKVFKEMAFSQVWQMAAGSLLKLFLGMLAIKPFGLLIGQVVQQGGGVLSLSFSVFNVIRLGLKKVTIRKLFFLLKYFSSFPKYRLPAQMLASFSLQSPLLLSAYIYTADVAGQLGLAIMALTLPISFLGATTGKAYFAEISSIGKSNPVEIKKITLSVVFRLAFLGSGPCLLVVVFGESLFVLSFGESWEKAGLFASILAIYTLLELVCNPLMHAFSVLNKQIVYFALNFIRASGILTVFLVSSFFSLAPDLAISFYSAFMVAYFSIMLAVVFFLIEKEVGDKSE